MLKLNYTEFDLYLERVSAPLEVWVAQRVMIVIYFWNFVVCCSIKVI